VRAAIRRRAEGAGSLEARLRRWTLEKRASLAVEGAARWLPWVACPPLALWLADLVFSLPAEARWAGLGGWLAASAWAGVR